MEHQTKKVLVFTPYFPPHMGGLERYVQEITSLIKREGDWDVIVVTSGKRCGADEREEKDGVIVYRLSYFCKISNTPFSFSWFKKVKKIINEEHPDVINIHAPVAGIGDIAALFSKKIPVVVTYHSGSMHKGKFIFDAIIWLYEHILMYHLLRRADRIVCSSDYIRNTFLRSYLYKSVTITPAVDQNIFKPKTTREHVVPTVLFVAGLSRAHKHKGLMSLFLAIQKLKERIPTIMLNVIGEGDMLEDYRDYAKELGIQSHVQFFGKLDGEKLAEAYRQADVLAAPSTNESFSMVVLEAMTSGLPVVATRVGGIPILVSHEETGLLFNVGNQEQFVSHLYLLLSDKLLAEKYGTNGREKVRYSFGWESRMKQYINIFNDIKISNAQIKPRITVVSPYFYPKIGGVENYAYHTAKRINQLGYRVNIITSNSNGRGYKKDEIDGMTIHYLPIWIRISNTPINFSWYFWIKKILKSEPANLLHLHAPVVFMPDLAAMIAKRKIPIVLTYHSGSMKKGRFLIDIFIYAYEHFFLKKLFKRVNSIVPVSQVFFDTQLGKCFKDKSQLIRGGVDTSVFKTTPLPRTTKIVTYVGRIEHSSNWKGIDQLMIAMIEVIKKIPNAQLELVGSGDAMVHFADMAKRLEISKHITMSGALSGNDLLNAYMRSSVVVLPSTSEAEQSSIVLIEAMASGRPVIGADIGGTPYIIKDRYNGLLVKPKNPMELSLAIISILSDDKFSETLASGAVISAKEVDWEKQAEKYQVLFTKLIANA